MATGNEKLVIDITAKDNASKVIDPLAKKVDKLDGSKTTVDVAADTKAAEQGLDSVLKATKKLDGSIEIDVQANMRQVLTALDDVTAETKQVRAAADQLGEALGPELAAKADTVRIVSELRRLGLTMEDIEGNTDELAGKLKELADADVGGSLGGALGTARGKIDEMSDSARGANSALANMVGNTAQDLGSLGGLASSAGVALGQMAEYASDATLAGEGLGSALKSMAAVAGPVAALALATQIVSGIVSGIQQARAEIAANSKKMADDVAQSFAKIEDATDIGGDVGEFADVLSASFLKTQKAAGATAEAMTRLGIPLRQLGSMLEQLDSGDNNRVGFFKNFLSGSDLVAGATDEITTAVAKAIATQDKFGDIAEQAFRNGGDAAKNFVVANRQVIEWLEQLDDAGEDISIDQTAKDMTAELLKAKGGAEALAAALAELGPNATEIEVASRAYEIYNQRLQEAAEIERKVADNAAIVAAKQQVANDATAAAEQLLDGVNSKLQEHISALQADAAALNDQSSAYGSLADDQISANEADARFIELAKDKKASTDDIRNAAVAAAKAHVELYTSMVEASGATATATGQLDAQNSSLLTAAQTAKGPARQAIIDYIATLNGISAEKATEIVANADTAQAETDLQAASENRKLTIEADAKTADAEREIDAVVNKPRTAYVKLTPLNGMYATGGVVGPEGGIAGEKKPELIEKDGRYALVTGPTPVSPGTRVWSGDETARLMAVGALDTGHVLEPYANGTVHPVTVTTTGTGGAAAAAQAAAQAAVKAQDKLKANAYELGRISRDEYLAYLQTQIAGTEDLSDEQVGYYRLIKGLQADAQRETDATAAANKKAADDAAKAAEDAVKADADRIKGIYEQAQRERKVFEDEGAQTAAIQNVFGKTGTERDSANENAARAVYQTILDKAAAAGLTEGSIEWDRFMRGMIQGAQGNLVGSGIDGALARYLNGIPALAQGGEIKGSPYGTLVRAGENNRSEVITPTDRLDRIERLLATTASAATKKGGGGVHIDQITINKGTSLAELNREVLWLSRIRA